MPSIDIGNIKAEDTKELGKFLKDQSRQNLYNYYSQFDNTTLVESLKMYDKLWDSRTKEEQTRASEAYEVIESILIERGYYDGG